ncbi:hypothetical protein NQZ79_g8108 [Umbelopsis isabellina]|nr:hypothetical protein NQZ79_g8108 [Umbelopsis isabellina]
MADQDMRTEDEKIQAMFEQNTEMWSPPKEDKNPASPQTDRNQNSPINKMNDGGNGQDMFNPMMAMNLNNPMMYQQQQQQQLQMQQFMMQQMQQNQHTQPGMQSGMRQQGQLPPESQPPPAGYVCYKCNQPGHWIYYCPNVPKGVHVRASNNQITDVDANRLIPNRSLRNSIQKYKDEHGDPEDQSAVAPEPASTATNAIQEPTSNGDTASHDTTNKTDEKPQPTTPQKCAATTGTPAKAATTTPIPDIRNAYPSVSVRGTGSEEQTIQQA